MQLREVARRFLLVCYLTPLHVSSFGAAGDFCFLLIIIIGCVLDDATYKIKKRTIYVICRLLGSDVKTNGVGRNGIAPSCFTDTHVFVFKVIKRGLFLTGLRAVCGLRCLRSLRY